jgi:putative drug exporter of the RND superfamily
MPEGGVEVKLMLSGLGTLARVPGSRVGKWVMVVLWVGALAALGPLAGKLTSVEDNQAASWLPGDAESTQVLKITERFRSSDQVPTIIVYERPSGLTPTDLAAIGTQAKQFASIDGVDGEVIGPIPSTGQPSPQAAQVIVPLTIGSDGWDALPGMVDKIRDITASNGAGLSSHVTGPGGYGADQAEAFAGIDGVLLYSALVVVVVLLLITYRSPVLWLLPVISVGGALAAAQGVIYLLAKHAGLTVNAQSAGILTVLVFGAGTDYALLLVSRYREELRRHEDRHEAMAVALHRAGPAIGASAATVVVAMLCLLFADLNSTSGLGPVAAIGIGIGLLAMLTLLPALLVICGRWVFWPVRPTYGSADHSRTSLWARVGALIARRPRLTWVAASLALGAIALGTLSLKSDGLSSAEAFTTTPDSAVGEQVLAKHFPAGAGQPIQVVANADRAGEVQAALTSVAGISSVAQPVVKDGYAYLEATSSDVPDGPAAMATLDRVRDAVHQVPGAAAQVGGTTALVADVEAANTHDRDLIIPIVLVVVFLILAGLLRSLVAPALLLATVVLSFFATLGLSAFFFTTVFGYAGTDASFPLFVFVFLVALGIDYNIFLMTRVHEEAGRWGTRRGALIGLSTTGGVITSAGLVLAGTFAALGTLPLTFLAELGFAVAVGVLIDTIIIRAVLVTALTLDVGRWMWWPSALARKHDLDPEEIAPPEPVPALASEG